ncbi:hypothetical protein SLS57_003985 [Botryosphaeria dothidea]
MSNQGYYGGPAPPPQAYGGPPPQGYPPQGYGYPPPGGQFFAVALSAKRAVNAAQSVAR